MDSSSPCLPAVVFPAAVSSSLSSSGLKPLGADGFGLHLLRSLQVVNGGTGEGPRVHQSANTVSVNNENQDRSSLTVSFAFVHFADEENGLLVDSHPVFVCAKQLLHVIFYDKDKHGGLALDTWFFFEEYCDRNETFCGEPVATLMSSSELLSEQPIRGRLYDRISWKSWFPVSVQFLMCCLQCRGNTHVKFCR